MATRCAACRDVPKCEGHLGGRVWAQHETVGTQAVPIGDLCKRCDDLRQDIFHWMNGPAFVDMLKQDSMRQDIDECHRIDG